MDFRFLITNHPLEERLHHVRLIVQVCVHALAQNNVKQSAYTFSIEASEESQAIEHDIMYGRGAYLYKEVERELAFQREQAKILRQFEAMRASIYQ